MSIQNGFAMINKTRVPDAVKRGRLFESAITRLAEWWVEFFDVEPTGHIRSRTFEEVGKKLAGLSDPKGKGKERAVDVDEDEGVDTDLAPTESSRVSGRGSPTGTYNNTR